MVNWCKERKSFFRIKHTIYLMISCLLRTMNAKKGKSYAKHATYLMFSYLLDATNDRNLVATKIHRIQGPELHSGSIFFGSGCRIKFFFLTWILFGGYGLRFVSRMEKNSFGLQYFRLDLVRIFFPLIIIVLILLSLSWCIVCNCKKNR